MKFKREDIGLYFALGLVGAGAGLLVGAFVASKLMGPEPIYIPEMEDDYEEYLKKIEPKISRVKKSEEKEEEWPELEEFIVEYEPNSVQ